jgi:hypothetical protein
MNNVQVFLNPALVGFGVLFLIVCVLGVACVSGMLHELRGIRAALESSLSPVDEDRRQQVQERLAAQRYRRLMEEGADPAEQRAAADTQDVDAYRRRQAVHHQECMFGGRPHAGGCITGHVSE